MNISTMNSNSIKPIQKIYSSEDKQKFHRRIDALQRFFDISKETAIYIYFRRKRGFPWCKDTDPKFLPWNNKLLNALLKADKILGFSWKLMQYGNEDEILKRYNINIEMESNSLDSKYKKKEKDTTHIDKNNEVWNIVGRNRYMNPDAVLLKQIGILPK